MLVLIIQYERNSIMSETGTEVETSHCLDVFVGNYEREREAMIEFLKQRGKSYEISKVQRGRMGEEKSLRIITPKAEELQRLIYNETHNGDDNDYEIHYSPVDARRSMRFMPDYNNPLGDQEFELEFEEASA